MRHGKHSITTYNCDILPDVGVSQAVCIPRLCRFPTKTAAVNLSGIVRAQHSFMWLSTCPPATARYLATPRFGLATPRLLHSIPLHPHIRFLSENPDSSPLNLRLGWTPCDLFGLNFSVALAFHRQVVLHRQMSNHLMPDRKRCSRSCYLW